MKDDAYLVHPVCGPIWPPCQTVEVGDVVRWFVGVVVVASVEVFVKERDERLATSLEVDQACKGPEGRESVGPLRLFVVETNPVRRGVRLPCSTTDLLRSIPDLHPPSFHSPTEPP